MLTTVENLKSSVTPIFKFSHSESIGIDDHIPHAYNSLTILIEFLEKQSSRFTPQLHDDDQQLIYDLISQLGYIQHLFFKLMKESPDFTPRHYDFRKFIFELMETMGPMVNRGPGLKSLSIISVIISRDICQSIIDHYYSIERYKTGLFGRLFRGKWL